MELATESHVAEKYGASFAFTSFFAGVLVALILINLFHFTTVRRFEHLIYAFMEGSILLFVLHNEGYAFGFRYPFWFYQTK